MASEARRTFEKFLNEDRASNLELGILPSRNRLIDRLLLRGDELERLYEEASKCIEESTDWNVQTRGKQTFLDCVLTVGLHWTPTHATIERKAKLQIKGLLTKAEMLASELSKVLREIDKRENTSAVSSDASLWITSVLQAAGEQNAMFKMWVAGEFKKLDRFDLKYWPTLPDFLDEIAKKCEAATVAATDPRTERLISSRKGGKSDSLRVLFHSFSEQTDRDFGGALPEDFRLTDEAIADLVNCILDLPLDDIVDGAYVKRFRQNEASRT